MKKIFKPNPYIILGVHRSGTTLMSNIFTRLGIFTGKKQNINKEAEFFFNLNNNTLKENHSTAYDFDIFLKKLKDKQFVNLSAEKFEKEIQKKINSKFFGYRQLLKYYFRNNHIKWGFKDPRTLLLLPIWMRLFPNAELLIILRNPIDVSMSIYYFEQKRYLKKLKKRPDLTFEMPLERAFKIWKNFTKLLLAAAEKYNDKSLIVRYEDLSKKEVLKQIIDFTNSSADINKIEKMIINKPNNYNKPDGYDNFIKIVKNDEFTNKLYPELKF